jgi:hypothetical protein
VFVQINHPRLDDHIAYFALGGFEDMQFARAGFDLEVDGLEVGTASTSRVPNASQDCCASGARGFHAVTV